MSLNMLFIDRAFSSNLLKSENNVNPIKNSLIVYRLFICKSHKAYFSYLLTK